MAASHPTSAGGQAELLQQMPGYRPLVADADGLVLACGADLFRLAPGDRVPRWLAHAGLGGLERRTLRPRLLQRLLRSGLQCGVAAGPNRLTVASKRLLFGVDTASGQTHVQPCASRGRPLNLVRVQGVPGFADQVCFGDYLSNPGCEAVSIWSDGGEGVWREAGRLASGEIEHIHTLIPDPERGLVWVLAGDFGQAAGIWVARDNFRHLEPVVRGTQSVRAAAGFALPEGLLYATDSQLEPNSIRLLRQTAGQWHSEEVGRLTGSCIHASQVGDQYCFSTAVEPGLGTGFLPLDLLDPRVGPGIERPWSDLFLGDLGRGFGRVAAWPKDVWPMRLLGFGTVSFPSGRQDSGGWAAHGTALRGLDGATAILRAP